MNSTSTLLSTSTPTTTTTIKYVQTTPSELNDTCNIYKDWRRNSKGFLITGYEGIPQNLVFNVCGVVLLLLVFSVIRKKAWNYGRIALLNDTKLSHVYYESSHHIIVGRSSVTETEALAGEGLRNFRGQQVRRPRPSDWVISDTGYFSWIKITFQLTDAQFLSKSGPDAVQYLSYQRHLIFLAAIVTLASFVIVLPLNLYGSSKAGVKPDITNFSQSTIFNLDNDSELLWIHEMLAIGILILSIVVMRHFSRSVKFVEQDTTIRRTILVSGITKTQCNDGKVRGHFETLYPGCKIEEISFAYDVKKLVENEGEKIGVVTSRKYWEEYILRSGKRPTMRPYVCGHVCCCCCCIMKTTDALNYYIEMEHKVRKQSDLERKRAMNKPLGMAFVTFTNVQLAERAVTEYRLTARFLKQTPISKYSRRLKTPDWIVDFAPLPDDLYWENLSISYKAWYFKAILVNMTLVLIVCFYSTPVFLLNAVNIKSQLTNWQTGDNSGSSGTMNGILQDTIPTFLLWLAAVTLPSLVALSDRFIGYWTKTAENRSRMIKTFTFLLFMVIILPSLGLTSLSGFFQNQEVQWKCIFSPSNGSFFVNYVITSCFLGTVAELMRIPELFVYAFKLCFAKSAADLSAIRKQVLWDFLLGAQYAWMMLIFAIFILFSLVCPIITIFGFIYLLFKHYVDRYNIYFAYAPCKVDKEVHGTAINFVIVCTFLQQLILVAYTNVGGSFKETSSNAPQQPINKALQAFTILGFCVTAALFIGQVFFNMCANFSPILYNKLSNKDSQTEEFIEEPSETLLSSPSYAPSNESTDIITLVSPHRRMVSENVTPQTSEQEMEIVVDRAATDLNDDELVPPHNNNNLVTTQTQTTGFFSPPKRHKRSSPKVKSLEERLNDIDREIMENHYRPGIDKPYGHYFPTVLRLDYDRDSTMAFNNLYQKSDITVPPPTISEDEEVFTPEDVAVLQHNNTLQDPEFPELVIDYNADDFPHSGSYEDMFTDEISAGGELSEVPSDLDLQLDLAEATQSIKSPSTKPKDAKLTK